MKLYDVNGKEVGEIWEEKRERVVTEPVINNYKMKFALVVGHEEGSQGAYGNAGVGEWEFNNDLVNEIIMEANADCKLFMRDPSIAKYPDQMLELHKRIDEWKADVSIEFHFNSFADPDVEGHEVLYCMNSTGGQNNATALNSCLDSYLPNSNRGTKAITVHNNGGWFCCKGRSYAMIIEPFFGSNQIDFMPGHPLRESLKTAVIEYLEHV